MKLFRFEQKIGKFRVLVQTRDIAPGAVKGRHIADGAVTGDKIGSETVEGRNIGDGAVTGEKIMDSTVTGKNIAPEAIDSKHIADESITGDEFRPNGVKPGKIANDAVLERNIKDGNVTLKKLSGKLQNFLKLLAGKDDDLQNQIDSLTISGMAVSNKFGEDAHVGISQKRLTEAINDIWYKLEEITGETLVGINLTVSPEYYIGEEGCDVNIVAETVTENGIIEYIKVFVNDEPVAEDGGEHEFEFDVHISDTSEIKCLAQVLGVVYERKVTITHYTPFWVGAGSNYSSVMTMGNIRNIGGNYNITFTAGQNLIIVVEDILRDKFVRADMNGVEIQFTETTQTIGEKTYKVLTSENPYQAGTYNIDINS